MRSAIELVACLYIRKGRKIIHQSDFDRFYKETEEMIRMIQGLRNSLS